MIDDFVIARRVALLHAREHAERRLVAAAHVADRALQALDDLDVVRPDVRARASTVDVDVVEVPAEIAERASR